ncbi:MAG: DUF1592 domain-containing protein [Myxococcota bacterium]
MRFGALTLSLALGCQAEIGMPVSNTPGAPGQPGGTGGPGGTQLPPGSPPPCVPAGHYALRRLTNQEYTNTVQDLLHTSATPGTSFQESPAGSSGFTNDSSALSIYPTLLSQYYATATTLAAELLASKGRNGGAYSKFVTCDPAQPSCGLATVTAFAKRALRRPPTTEDLDATSGLMAVFNGGGSFDQGLYDVTVSLLMHPEFLLIPVVDPRSTDPSASFALDDFELASRLSYFLWQSMPDEALFAAATAGSLHETAALQTQVARMLRDPKAAHLRGVLRDELADLGKFARVDLSQLGQPNTLRDAMIGETDAFLDDLIKNDKSALLLLSSDQSFVNKTLADFYGLSFPAGADPSRFVAVTSGRIGLGSQGAVLTNSAGGNASFTNPIKRGHWIAKKLFCNEPPPPPPNVPPLPAATQANPTIRGRLAAHLNQPSCVNCHATMDTFGLGAENYDAFGKYRSNYPDQARVDASGSFPDGTPFADSVDMYTKLADQAAARDCVAEQLMRLALSRALNQSERCVAEGVAKSSLTRDAHFSDLIASVATTQGFLTQTGEAP